MSTRVTPEGREGVRERVARIVVEALAMQWQFSIAPTVYPEPDADEVTARILAAIGEGEPVAWRPIESAPKDGTEILAWFTMHGGRIQIARWDADPYAKRPRPYWKALSIYGKSAERSGQPSHWMPLPPSPTEARPSHVVAALPALTSSEPQ